MFLEDHTFDGSIVNDIAEPYIGGGLHVKVQIRIPVLLVCFIVQKPEVTVNDDNPIKFCLVVDFVVVLVLEG